MTPSDSSHGGRILSSWKDIAAELGVSVRTAQRWERTAGLPVHRQGSGKNARVFASQDELRTWVQKGGPAADPVKSRRWGRVVAGALITAALGAAMGWRALGHGPPAQWRFESGKLKILDARGRLCWERTFGESRRKDLTYDEVLLADADGDGKKEVFYNHVPAELGPERGVLYCFEGSGRLRWQLYLGSHRTFGDREFSAVYAGQILRLVRLEGKPFLLVVSNHHIYYPSQAVILDPRDGRVLEEYWHPGALRHCVIQDLDGDGLEEAIFGGINNPGLGLGHPALAVLTLPFSRAQQQAARVQTEFPSVTGGGELAYLLLPRPDVSTALGLLPQVASLEVEESRRLMVRVPLPENGAVFYHLDFSLTVVEHRFSDNLPSLHRRLHVQGILEHDWSDREAAKLGQALRFPHAPNGNDPRLARLWRW
jgi:hypothetical protein